MHQSMLNNKKIQTTNNLNNEETIIISNRFKCCNINQLDAIAYDGFGLRKVVYL